MIFNFPTLLTLFRTLLAPLVIIVYYLPWEYNYWLSAFLFFIAGVTDWLDGFLARRFNQTSNFGAFLDPLADKILVAGVMIMLVEHYRQMWVMIPAIIIIYREIMVSGLREWMATRGERHKVSVALLGKIKTIAQMIAIGGLILIPEIEAFVLPSKIALWVATVLTVWSMAIYFYDARKSFNG